MKKFTPLPVFSLLAILLLSSCLKDKLTKTYTIYTPVYKTRAEVTANIKTNGSKDIKNAGKFFLYGKYLFLNEVDKGIHIIDNANPSNPRNVGFIDIPGNADLAIRNNTLYADFYSDLVTIDITNPMQSTVKSIVRNVFPYRRYVNNTGFTWDSSRVIVDWVKKDTTIDMNQELNKQWGCPNCSVLQYASPSSASSLAYAPVAVAGSMARFAVLNNYLYVVDQNDLNVFSVSSPQTPVFTKKVSIGWGIETLYPFKDKLFIGSNLGMFIYDISDGSTPQKMGQFMHARVCDPVIADDEFAFVTLRSGTNCMGNNININQLDVVNIKNLAAPFHMISYNLTNPHGLSKDGNLLFICDGKDGLKIFDASDVYKLKLIKHFTGFESFDVITNNNVAMVVEKSGIRQFDYSDPANIKYLSEISW